MTQRDADLSLRHMLDAAREAVAYASGLTAAEIDRDRLRELALERLLEILGEAAAQTLPAVRAQYPEIPWARIVGMRNEIIHGYASVDVDIVLGTIRENLPPLIRQLEEALGLPPPGEPGAPGQPPRA
jgi:uncharacterized protein with HEPN domain